MEDLHAGDPRWIGTYRLLARLGGGGMGQVYLGRSERGRTVAVKLVRPELAGLPEFRRRFRQEVEAARRVAGPWTAAVLDADTEAAQPWVATAYVAGPDLHTVVDRDGPLPETSVRILADRLARALLAVHGAGLVHRDLKPSNVLLTVDGPRVIDFGIARALEADTSGDLTRTGIVVGSPGFMSPEQVRGLRVGPAADVFCLGAVLAFAATGRPPFGVSAGSGEALMYRIAHEEPDLEGVPEGLLGLVRGCLAKDAAARPAPDKVAAGVRAPDEGAWLPAPLLAQLGREAARLLDAESPRTAVYDVPPPGAVQTPPAPAHPTPPPGPVPATPPPPWGTPPPPEPRPQPAYGPRPQQAYGPGPWTPPAQPAPALPRPPGNPWATPPPPTGPRRSRLPLVIVGASAAVALALVVAAVAVRSSGGGGGGGGGSSDSPSASATGAVPTGYLGAWDGRVLDEQGAETGEIHRIVITQGERGAEVASVLHAQDAAVCAASGTLDSAGGPLVITNRLTRAHGTGCAASGEETLRLRSDGKLDWSAGTTTAVLEPAVTGERVVDDAFLGTWVPASGASTNPFTVTVQQGAIGSEVFYLSVDSDDGHCEGPSLLVSVRDGLVFGPPQAVAEKSRGDCSASGGSGLLSREGTDQLRLTALDGSGDSVVLDRSG
ncbi:serine/threonine-protein kinase [Streptomyces sp. NPDC051940]|uniref:serine/threonine-protein kinase n=1 Tax=Streptomyces sp. NPDC051940 TaxID=3155675 RepID=UPI00344749B0